MVISKRIKTIGNFIEESDIVADIGADHGLLELYLIAKYENIHITAIENKKGPYDILDRSLRGFKNIRLSLSDGLTAVDRKTNTAILAWMGWLNIKKILEKNPSKVQQLQKIIIDAHRDQDIARKTID